MQALYATRMGGEAPLHNIEIGERPKPEPPPGWVRVRVRAASVNHHDYFTLRGIVGYPIELPRILGCDAAGVVDAYGAEPPPAAPPPGAEVAVYSVTFCGTCVACTGGADPMLCKTFTMLSDGKLEGSFAEFVIVPACNVVPKPAGWSHEETACLGVTFLTAYRMLFVKAGLRPGQCVLVQGAGGGLATAAIQLASNAGIRVIASSRSEQKLATARGLGAADAVVAGKDAAKAVLKMTGGEGVDAVIESVGEPTWPTSLRALRQGGRIVVAGATAGPNPPADLGRVFWRQLQILGSTMGSLAEFTALLDFVARRNVRPLIDRTYTLAHGREAFERLAADEQTGKLVLQIP